MSTSTPAGINQGSQMVLPLTGVSTITSISAAGAISGSLISTSGNSFTFSPSTTQMTMGGTHADYVIKLYGDNHELLVEIKRDGTVISHVMGSDLEAAKRFYDVLTFYGSSLQSKVVAAESKVQSLEAENRQLRSQVDLARQSLTDIKDIIKDSDINPKAITIKRIAATAAETL